MKIIFGIGNPGKRYENTPHNVGFFLLDFLATQNGGKQEHQAVTQQIQLEGQRVLLAKPQTYVNLSGDSARNMLAYYKLKTKDLIVVVDDVNLELGAIRIRTGGSHGGHNGLRSIVEKCGSDFPRIRVGVGPCPPHMDLSSFVLKKLSSDEKQVFQSIGEIFEDLVSLGMREGWERAAVKFNRKSI